MDNSQEIIKLQERRIEEQREQRRDAFRRQQRARDLRLREDRLLDEAKKRQKGHTPPSQGKEPKQKELTQEEAKKALNKEKAQIKDDAVTLKKEVFKSKEAQTTSKVEFQRLRQRHTKHADMEADKPKRAEVAKEIKKQSEQEKKQNKELFEKLQRQKQNVEQMKEKQEEVKKHEQEEAEQKKEQQNKQKDNESTLQGGFK